MIKILSYKRLYNLMFSFFGAGITFALLYGALNSVPLLDDYSWPSAFKEFGGFVDVQFIFYERVNGRVLSTFFSTLLLNNSVFYGHYGFVLVLFILGSSYLYFKLFYKLTDSRAFLSISLSILINLFLVANSKQLATQFFWLTGVLVYQLSFILALIAIIFYFGEYKFKWLVIFFTSFLSVLAFEMVVFLFVPLILVLELRKLRSNYKAIIGLSSIMAFSLLINLKAPGTSIKSEEYSAVITEDFFLSMKTAFEHLMRFLLDGQFITLLAFGIILYIARLTFNIHKQINSSPVLLSLLVICNHLVFQFIYFYKIGNRVAPRVENFLNIFDFVIVILFVFSLRLLKFNIKLQPLFLTLSFSMIVLPFVRVSNLGLLIGDAKNGRMNAYKFQMERRYDLIENCQSEVCLVPKIQNIPYSIFYQPLPSDSVSNNSFYCSQLGDFYNKAWVFTDEN
tara:strand:+ start:530 stop:1885 length:1356 start_codon:yes stop_codon:yes gene_type:complete